MSGPGKSQFGKMEMEFGNRMRYRRPALITSLATIIRSIRDFTPFQDEGKWRK